MASPLDMLMRPISVVWGGGGMFAVLEFTVDFRSNFTGYNDAPIITNIPFGGTYDFVGDGNVVQNPVTLVIELPEFTDDMRRDGLMWSYPCYFNSDVTHHSGSATVLDQGTFLAARQFSLGYAFGAVFTKTDLVGHGPVPGGPFGSVRDCATQWFVNYQPDPAQGHIGLGPHCTVTYLEDLGVSDPDKITHTETVEFDSFHDQAKAIVFFNLTKIRNLPQFEGQEEPIMHFDVITDQSPSNRRYHWIAKVGTYLKVPTEDQIFEVDGQNEPLWFDAQPGDYDFEAQTEVDGINDEINVPTTRSTFTINLKTAEVTASQDPPAP